jgi:hypothetical protein
MAKVEVRRAVRVRITGVKLGLSNFCCDEVR